QGTSEQTGNPLDIAIEGDGFFQVQSPNGELRYTRAGSFRMDEHGRIVTADGLLLVPNLSIPPGIDTNRITIGSNGIIEGAPTQSDQLPTQIGQIQIATFLNPSGLSSEGSNLYASSAASGQPQIANPGTL